MDTVIRARFRSDREQTLVDKIISWALRLGTYDAVKVVRVTHCFHRSTSPFAV